jgi:ubiquitin carboxyl-terminal hydrolase 20/33
VAPISANFDFAPYFSNESPEKIGQTDYELKGIVDHHGGAGGGHYTAQCRHLASGAWMLYDDEGVQKMGAPIFGDSTYMLFFERSGRAKEA